MNSHNYKILSAIVALSGSGWVAAQDDSKSDASLPSAKVIEEVIVSANRRDQSVQDIANAIQVVTGDALEKTGAGRFEDYIYTIPGADLGDNGTDKKIAIRGIANTAASSIIGSSSPIGVYLDEVPVQGNGNIPDLDIYDLARIEVLKGPQGTLYGEGAQGGALKMLLNQPSPDGIEAKVDAGYGRTKNAKESNHFVRGALNVPLSATWAARAVVSERFDAGFVDYFNIPEKARDDIENTSGRLQLKGDVTEKLGLSLLYMRQSQRYNQFPSIQPSEGDLRNRNTEPQFAETDFSLAGITFEYAFDFATLTSTTSWFENERESLQRGPVLPAVVAAIGAEGSPGGVLELIEPVLAAQIETIAENEWGESESTQRSVAQEFRLVSSGDKAIDWIGGVFYRKRDNDYDIHITNDSDAPSEPYGEGFFEFWGREIVEQYAVFGELDIELPWDLSLNLGLRAFRETVTGEDLTQKFNGVFGALSAAQGYPTVYVSNNEEETQEITPKVALTWNFDGDMMAYASYSEGVRSGGNNYNSAIGVTPAFEPDYLKAYEVGLKTQLFDRRLTASLAVFHNDWRDLQLATTETGYIGEIPLESEVILNAGSAFSQGIEMELIANFDFGLSVGLPAFYGDGEIEEGDARGVVPDGSALPQFAKLSYAPFARFDFDPIWGVSPYVSASMQYIDERWYVIPGDSLFDWRAFDEATTYSAQIGAISEKWEIVGSVSNITDERKELGNLPSEPDTVSVLRPRTWTVRFAMYF